MSNGRLAGIVNTKETNQEELLRLSAKSVSYTHLDVYKRQVASCTTFAFPSTFVPHLEQV